MTIKINSK